MAENENALAGAAATGAVAAEDVPQQAATGAVAAEDVLQQQDAAAPASNEEITYHAVEKDGQVTAIWEMQGRKHLRTIDPRSRQGEDILRLYTAEHHDHA